MVPSDRPAQESFFPADESRIEIPGEDATLRRIVDTIVEALDPEQVILVGPRARGDDTAHTDYDICVVADSDRPYHERNMEVHHLFSRRDFSMDAFVLTRGVSGAAAGRQHARLLRGSRRRGAV